MKFQVRKKILSIFCVNWKGTSAVIATIRFALFAYISNMIAIRRFLKKSTENIKIKSYSLTTISN